MCLATCAKHLVPTKSTCFISKPSEAQRTDPNPACIRAGVLHHSKEKRARKGPLIPACDVSQLLRHKARRAGRAVCKSNDKSCCDNADNNIGHAADLQHRTFSVAGIRAPRLAACRLRVRRRSTRPRRTGACVSRCASSEHGVASDRPVTGKLSPGHVLEPGGQPLRRACA